MAHDVFISYATEDKEIAKQVCLALEGQGIRCWVAPRDIPIGSTYQEVILDAISASRFIVLIFSASSNTSNHVFREISEACDKDLVELIFPFRLEDIPYSDRLRYYLGSTQWADALTPSLESGIESLVSHIRSRMGGGTAGGGAGW